MNNKCTMVSISLGSVLLALSAVNCSSSSTPSAAAGGSSSTVGGGAAAGSSNASQGGTTSSAGASSHAGATATGGGGGATSTAAAVTCTSYCTNVMAACTGTQAQYASQAACMGYCSGLPAGNVGDTSGNSLACRGHYATMSTSDPTQCDAAGPTGGDTDSSNASNSSPCGDACEAVCDVAMTVCTGSLSQYTDNAACLSACRTWAVSPTYNTSDTSKNDFGCRVYHISAAASSATAATTHCPHVVTASAVCTM